MKKTAKEVTNTVKDIESEIAKYQAKIHKLTAKKEMISRKVIDSKIENIPENIQNIVGQLCVRYNIPWLLAYNFTNDTFDVIGYIGHGDTIKFDECGKYFNNPKSFVDYSFPINHEENECDYLQWFCVKFSPIDDGQNFGMSSVKIDIVSGKILSEDEG